VEFARLLNSAELNSRWCEGPDPDIGKDSNIRCWRYLFNASHFSLHFHIYHCQIQVARRGAIIDNGLNEYPRMTSFHFPGCKAMMKSPGLRGGDNGNVKIFMDANSRESLPAVVKEFLKRFLYAKLDS